MTAPKICKRRGCGKPLEVNAGRKKVRDETEFCCRRCSILDHKTTNPYVIGHQRFMQSSLRRAGYELGWIER